jgi:hypothetical protein
MGCTGFPRLKAGGPERDEALSFLTGLFEGQRQSEEWAACMRRFIFFREDALLAHRPAAEGLNNAHAFATLERTLIVGSDTPQIMKYFCAAYRRAVVPMPAVVDERTDCGAILAGNGENWLEFNGRPVEHKDEKPATNFRLAFYGASKLIRLSFRQNDAWRSLYAAALRLGDRAILVSADSGIGKTTLALELIRRGARLYTDEFAFVRRADSFVSGLPRALMIRERTLAIFSDPRLRTVCEASPPRAPHGDRIWDNIDAGDVFGEDVFATPAPLAAAFLLHRADGPPTSERVSPAVAAVDFTQRLNADATGFARFVDTAEMLAHTPCYRVTAQMPTAAADTIERLL